MDSLLELLENYRCHLKRGTMSTASFLQKNFQEYLSNVKAAAEPNLNPLLGSEMCFMVQARLTELEKHCNQIIDVLGLYGKGKIVPASVKAFRIFDSMKAQLMLRYSGAYRLERYYRIRPYSHDNPFDLVRKELFHIPYNKNHLVGTERYSMPGHPCLYLASQAELCWYECGQPSKFAISKFDIPQAEDNYLKLIDFSEKLMPLKHSFFGWFHNEADKEIVRQYLLKYICTYPLRAACSVVVEYPGSRFIEEYIIPQLLLQWVANDADFDGIRYESCNSFDDVKSFGGHNLVLVTKEFDADGYDIHLRSNIGVGEPMLLDVNTVTISPALEDCLMGKSISESPFFWNMDDADSSYKKI